MRTDIVAAQDVPTYGSFTVQADDPAAALAAATARLEADSSLFSDAQRDGAHSLRIVALQEDDQDPLFADVSLDPDDPLSGVAALYDDADAFDIGARIDRRAGGVWIHGDGDPQVIAIAEFIRRLAPSALPTGFTWANDGSRSQPGAFGGGYALITHADYDVADVTALLDEALEAARG